MPAEAADAAGPTALEVAGPTSRRKVFSWAMWDWGSQPFNTVITTFVFSVYITSESFGATNATSTALAISTAISGLFVARCSPRCWARTPTAPGARCATCASRPGCSRGCPPRCTSSSPSPAFLWLGLVLLAVGSVVSEIAAVNYNATIEQVATTKTIGRVSGFGWGMGYLGGIIVLLLLYFLLIQPEVGLFGVSDLDGTNIRVSMLLCGLWTLVFTIPAFLVLRDRPHERVPGVGVVMSYKLVWRSVRGLWVTSRDTVYFLLASALFRDGLAGVFAFGAVLAHGTFGLSAGDVIVFGAAANIVAGFATMAFGMLDDRVGPKRVILVSLGALVTLGILIFILHDGGPATFWVLGLLMTVFVGPAQAASRSFLARLIPEGKSGEIFGLYATTGRVVSFLSPAAFGLFIALGALVTGQENTQYWGILGIVVILAAGFAVMLPVKEHTEHRM